MTVPAAVLTVADLRILFPARADRPTCPVDGVSFSIAPGEAVGLVGESGSGKSLTALALVGLVPPPGRVGAGSAITVGDADVLRLDRAGLRRLRGGTVGMVFQDPTAAMNPLIRARAHVEEAVRAHRKIPRAEARTAADRLLGEVGFPEDLAGAWPHQLSGGLRQRVMLAAALAGDPDLLVADEPTSALDVTVQTQILDLLDHLRATRGLAVLIISHDLAVVAGRTDRVAVMYAGQIVEAGPTGRLFGSPAHPYTRALLAAAPRLEPDPPRVTPIPGQVPRASAWPAGCRFHPRCPLVVERCRTEPPVAAIMAADHVVRCWLPEGEQEPRT